MPSCRLLAFCYHQRGGWVSEWVLAGGLKKYANRASRSISVVALVLALAEADRLSTWSSRSVMSLSMRKMSINSWEKLRAMVLSIGKEMLVHSYFGGCRRVIVMPVSDLCKVPNGSNVGVVGGTMTG